MSDLRERLRAACEGAPSPSQLLRALAIAVPEDALTSILGHTDELLASFPAADLSFAIAHAFRTDPRTHERYASPVLVRFHARLTLEAATTVADAVPSYDGHDEGNALESLLRRFPNETTFLRLAIRIAQKRRDLHRADTLLTRLATIDRTPSTVSFAYRGRNRDFSPADSVASRVAFVSSYTIDGLVPFVDLACREHGIMAQTYVAPFNSWTRDVIDPSSGLRNFRPDIVFLSVAIDDLIPELDRHVSSETLSIATDEALVRVLGVVDEYAKWGSGRPLVVHSFHSAFASPLGVLDGSHEPSRTDWLAALNARLAAELRARRGCFLLDVAASVVAAGGRLTDDPKLRHIAGMRLAPTALAAVAEAYARYIAPASGVTRKCVVLDLDNTLWGGVVGEDGKDGIRLHANGRGSEFVEFQKFLRSLAERGILLAINSKNNADDALDVIRTHESMLLRESSFSAIRINWKPKSENMLEIASELNIGVDSLVFVDDNPDERERMRQLLPRVLTVEMPRDTTRYRATLEGLPELQTLAVTAEDRIRVDQYETARERARAKNDTIDVVNYLQSLEINVTIEPLKSATYSRVAQLFSKTNQFNTTTRRFTQADVESFAADETKRLWTLSSRDKFGDHGLVALALVEVAEPAWTIESFLMSCRVIGYGIESALLAFVIDEARRAGAVRIEGDFIETAKNVPAKDFYARHEFTANHRSDGLTRWVFDLAESLSFPAWIVTTR